MTNIPIRSVFRIVKITPLTSNRPSVQLIAIPSRFLILKYSGYSAMTCTHMRYRHNQTYQIGVSDSMAHSKWNETKGASKIGWFRRNLIRSRRDR